MSVTVLIKRTNPRTHAITTVQVTASTIKAAVKVCPGQVVFPIDPSRYFGSKNQGA